MDFSEEDEAEETTDEDGDSMDFDVDGDGEGLGKLSDEGEQSVAIVTMPSANMNEELYRRVHEELERFSGTVTNIKPVSGSAVQAEIEKQGGDECIVETICLAEIGENAGVDRILVTRLKASDSGLELATDYFDVKDRLFLKYNSTKNLSGDDAVVEAIEPALKIIFEVRDLVNTPDYYEDKNDGTFQTIAAWSTAGLSLASLGAGIYFGLEASDLESKLVESPQSGTIYNMTQKEAAEKLRETESAATTANIFYGVSAGLAIASGILFYIQGGSDVATQEELDARAPTHFRFAPVVTKHSVGFGAGFDF